MSVDNTLEDRGSRYGDFLTHATLCQRIKEVMRSTTAWAALASDQKQALETIADKIARILNGDPDYGDNWHDIQGYARLVERRLALEESGHDQK